ncbi:hypothetical protein SAMD00019534_108210 [Acytostelium subglobosum LB1]|uniref:hypothetical protein n=1 Tax=Acytostelium subglobosum LB1 TaxID=1410327 RepID=UPI0006449AAD|nr:hypothetical protein SAMD00019534_108210 [Acytostelium subglobosum LB1]GAM27645.1 hypothetical protein SAMD00019534_108210 [Acytostelium subglobosum LB1]|eukprot:XP_012749304.1 hypothetical protein SAMD00019534_108210 [Acytostelium subglobosum LB1]
MMAKPTTNSDDDCDVAYKSVQWGRPSTFAVDIAASTGNVELIKFLHDNRTEGWTPDAIRNAVAYGHLPAVRYILDNEMGCIQPQHIMFAIKSRKADLLQSLCELDKEFEPTMDHLTAALTTRDITLVQYLLDTYSHVQCFQDVEDQIFTTACVEGNIELIKYLYTRFSNKLTKDDALAVQVCSASGPTAAIQVLQFLSSSGFPISPDCLKSASERSLPLTQWLVENVPESRSKIALIGAIYSNTVANAAYLIDRLDIWTPSDVAELILDAYRDEAKDFRQFNVTKYLQKRFNVACRPLIIEITKCNSRWQARSLMAAYTPEALDIDGRPIIIFNDLIDTANQNDIENMAKFWRGEKDRYAQILLDQEEERLAAAETLAIQKEMNISLEQAKSIQVARHQLRLIEADRENNQ